MVVLSRSRNHQSNVGTILSIAFRHSCKIAFIRNKFSDVAVISKVVRVTQAVEIKKVIPDKGYFTECLRLGENIVTIELSG